MNPLGLELIRKQFFEQEGLTKNMPVMRVFAV